MNAPLNQELQELIDEQQITKLLYKFCRAIDRNDQQLLRSLYHEDATHIQGPCNGPVEQFFEMAKHLAESMSGGGHHITNILIEVDGNSATSESYAMVISAGLPGESGEPIDLIISARFLDRLEKRNGEWKLAHRCAVFDTNLTLPHTARWDGPFYGEQCKPRRQAGKSDPLYRFLSGEE